MSEPEKCPKCKRLYLPGEPTTIGKIAAGGPRAFKAPKGEYCLDTDGEACLCVQIATLTAELSEANTEHERIALAIGDWPGDDLATEVGEMRAELEQVKVIIGKLPCTADGVTIVPPMELWYVVYTGQIESQECKCIDLFAARWLVRHWPDWCREVSECYSTREAAEAALAEMDGK